MLGDVLKRVLLQLGLTLRALVVLDGHVRLAGRLLGGRLAGGLNLLLSASSTRGRQPVRARPRKGDVDLLSLWVDGDRRGEGAEVTLDLGETGCGGGRGEVVKEVRCG